MSSEIKDKAISLKSSGIDLTSRLALRPREAAEALGISERTLRQLAPELPRVSRGGVVLYPVEALREWLQREVRTEGDRVRIAADEALERLRAQ